MGKAAMGLRELTKREHYAETRDWASLSARSCFQANKPSQLLCKCAFMQMFLLRCAPLRLMKEVRMGMAFGRGRGLKEKCQDANFPDERAR